MSSLVELRQYTLHPGRRDDLITLFDREFVESQEACGMTVIGQFRDLDRPDHFVWLRDFDSMAARLKAMQTFYSGPVWQTHRNAANASMIDSDDVLLLRTVGDGPGFRLGQPGPRDAAGQVGRGAVVCGVHRLAGVDDPLADRLQAAFAPRLIAAGLAPVAVLVTEPSPNDFPGLPVREGETVLVWVSVLPDPSAADRGLSIARADPALTPLFAAPLQILQLQPTARSRLHG
jgi:hypothetical protein